MNEEINKIFESNKIHIINGMRFYEFEMTNPLPELEDTVPYYFKFQDIEVYANSRKNMQLGILRELDKKYPMKEEDLLSIKYTFSKADVFSKTKRTNFYPFKNVYLNCNHTSTHSMMSIQCILKAYGIPLDLCFFLIKKHFNAEKREVREAIKNSTIADFKRVLTLKKVSDDRQKEIINAINNLNQILLKISSSFDDFFLFDNYNYFSNYFSSTLNYLKKRFANQSKMYIKYQRPLSHLDSFYKERKLYTYLLDHLISDETIRVIKKEVEYLLNYFDVNVITISKLYARLKITNEELLKQLGELNSEKGLFFIIKIYLSKDYYFKYPYICNDIQFNLTNEQLIIAHVNDKQEFDLGSVNDYIGKMHIKKPNSLTVLFDTISNDFVQVAKGKYVSKSLFDLEEHQIDAILNDVKFYINSFGNINSSTYAGYSSLPVLDYERNKYLLAGICKSFLSNEIEFSYVGKAAINYEYSLKIRH